MTRDNACGSAALEERCRAAASRGFTLGGSPMRRNHVGPAGSGGAGAAGARPFALFSAAGENRGPCPVARRGCAEVEVRGGRPERRAREQPRETKGGDRRHELLACLPPCLVRNYPLVRLANGSAVTRRQTRGTLERPEETIKAAVICSLMNITYDFHGALESW